MLQNAENTAIVKNGIFSENVPVKFLKIIKKNWYLTTLQPKIFADFLHLETPQNFSHKKQKLEIKKDK